MPPWMTKEANLFVARTDFLEGTDTKIVDDPFLAGFEIGIIIHGADKSFDKGDVFGFGEILVSSFDFITKEFVIVDKAFYLQRNVPLVVVHHHHNVVPAAQCL